MALNRVGFPFVYGVRTPPRHDDFLVEWRDDMAYSRDGHSLRCVFVASRTALQNDQLIGSDWVNSASFGIPVVLGEEVSGVFQFKDAAPSAGAVVVPGEEIALVTPVDQWHFALAIPVCLQARTILLICREIRFWSRSPCRSLMERWAWVPWPTTVRRSLRKPSCVRPSGARRRDSFLHRSVPAARWSFGTCQPSTHREQGYSVSGRTDCRSLGYPILPPCSMDRPTWPKDRWRTGVVSTAPTHRIWKVNSDCVSFTSLARQGPCDGSGASRLLSTRRQSWGGPFSFRPV